MSGWNASGDSSIISLLRVSLIRVIPPTGFPSPGMTLDKVSLLTLRVRINLCKWNLSRELLVAGSRAGFAYKVYLDTAMPYPASERSERANRLDLQMAGSLE